MFSLLNDSEAQAQPSRIDKNLYEILFTSYAQRDVDGLHAYLKRCDALDVFRILLEVNRELTSVRLENLVLTDFLEKNDPRLLVGMDQVRRQTIESRVSAVEKRKSKGADSGMASPSVGAGRADSRSMSLAAESIAGSVRKFQGDERINYRTKAEMAEKLASEVYKSCEALEAKGTHKVKILKGEIEELRYRCADTVETITIFELHFIKNNTLEGASEKQMETHLRKFVNNWLKNGRALLGTMRLKITSLQELCHQQQTALISKADLSGMLGPVDFEQLQMKRNDQNKLLEEKNVSLAGLKEVTGKASLALAKEKKIVITIEQKSKVLNAKTADMVRSIGKLEAESAAVEREVELAEESLKNLKIQVEGYEAPSVIEYIRIKQEVIALEKEEKLLLRKNYIQNIKLKNITMKLRMQQERASA